MKLYGERGINPLGGCLPIFVQLPIFIVLYQTIKRLEHLESFRTGGLLWFKDLTVADPYFILPVAYVLTMMASQELTIRRTAPQQKNLMRVLPVAFGFFLFRFPAGLFVYWVTSNVLTFCQNLIVYRAAPRTAAEGTPIPESDATTKAGSINAETGDAPSATTRRRKKRPESEGELLSAHPFSRRVSRSPTSSRSKKTHAASAKTFALRITRGHGSGPERSRCRSLRTGERAVRKSVETPGQAFG